MATSKGELAGAGVALLRLTSWAVIWGCFLIAMVEAFFILTPFWSDNPRMLKLNLSGSRSKAIQGELPYEYMIAYAFSNMQVIFWWATLLTISLLSIWMRHWPFNTRLPVDAKLQDLLNGAGAKCLRILKFQLPPQRFWAAWLEGGLNTIDVLVVGVWAGMCTSVTYCEYKVYMKYCWETFETTGEWCYTDLTGTRMGAFGLAAGFALTNSMFLVFLPIPRSSFLQYLLGTDFVQLIKYHRWLGHGTMWMLLLHGLPYYIQFIHLGTFWKETFAWQYAGINYLAGGIGLLFGMLLWITTIDYVRRRWFNVFLWSHIIGYLGFAFFGVVHWAGTAWFLPGMVLYLMDLVFRLSQWSVRSNLESQFIAESGTFVTFTIKFHKDANVRPANFVFLNVPAINTFAWHPVSIAAIIPTQDGLTTTAVIHIKCYGAWTKALVRLLREHGSITVRADGPYGASDPVPDWTHHEAMILVAGGIGVTPLLGMLREVVNMRQLQSSTKALSHAHVPKKIHLIWAVRDFNEFDLLDQSIADAASDAENWLCLHLFCTGSNLKQGKEQPVIKSEQLADVGNVEKIHVNDSSTRYLQPYGFGDLHWAITHVAAIVGAYFGILMGQAFLYEGYVTSELGYAYWLGGAIHFLGLLVGAMGLPALLIYPFQTVRYRKHVKACIAAQQRSSKEAKQDLRKDLFLPAQKSTTMEAGQAGLVVQTGRPEIVKMVTELASAQHGRQVAVFASGPSSMVAATQVACHTANKASQGLASELLDHLGSHLSAAQEGFESQRNAMGEQAVIYMCANLDALYYDLLQFYLCSRSGPPIPPPHDYFSAVVAKNTGNSKACRELLGGLDEDIRQRWMEAWDLQTEESDGISSFCYQLRDGGNPLLRVLWFRFQEGCRLLANLRSGHKAAGFVDSRGRGGLEERAPTSSKKSKRKQNAQIHMLHNKKARLAKSMPQQELSTSSTTSSDSDASDSGEDSSDSSEVESMEMDPTGGASEPKPWPGHPALRAWRESGKECHFYAYAPPNKQALAALAGKAPLVEIGAGMGYWAETLRREKGVRVAAYDSHPPSPASSEPNEYHGPLPAIRGGNVAKGGPKSAAGPPEHSLLLCYPPPGNSMAAAALKAHRGKYVCVVGEWAGDTGDAAFAADLLRGYWLEQCIPLPNWSDTAHSLTIWRRQSAMGKRRQKNDNGVSGHALQDLPGGLRCSSCGIPHPAFSKRGVPLRRCRWCKEVAYCSENCWASHTDRHRQLHSLRWVFLDTPEPQWKSSKDFDNLLL